MNAGSGFKWRCSPPGMWAIALLVVVSKLPSPHTLTHNLSPPNLSVLLSKRVRVL